jgi:hypothetical protein
MNMLQAPQRPQPGTVAAPQFPMSVFVVASNSVSEQISDFKAANQGSGQILHRQWKIGTHEATVAIDTGCAKPIISQQFLDRFEIPVEFFRTVDYKIDNGTTLFPVTRSIVLPVQFATHHVATEFLVVPQLAAPLDALLSWSWGRKLNVVLDFATNNLSMTQLPPASCLVAATFHQLRLKEPTSATSIQSVPLQPID